MDRLLTPEEAAEIFAVSPKSIREWLRQGKLKGTKVGRLWRIKKSDLEAFFNSQPSLQQTEELPEKSAETAEFQILKIPNDLYYLIEFEIYRGICRRIEERDPKAKELVDWYIKNIGISGKSLLKKLKETNQKEEVDD